MCYHDRKFEESLLADKQTGFCGSELIAQYGEIKLKYPESKWVFIVRDSTDCLESFKKFAGDRIPASVDLNKWWHERSELLHKTAKEANGLILDYHQLNEEACMRYLWSWLLPADHFDLKRWQLLDKLNIQQDKPKHLWQ